MTEKAIDQAFEGRWRIKAESHSEAWIKGVKDLCRDFFTAGILLGEGFRTEEITFDDGQKGTVTFKRDLDFDTFDGGFSIFWELYEKKVGRPKCEKLWSKLTVKEREECLAYIPLYKHAQPEKQYRKNPETFLRNKSWNDELIFRNNGNSKPTPEQQQNKLADILVG
jgi:hypothetical protein